MKPLSRLILSLSKDEASRALGGVAGDRYKPATLPKPRQKDTGPMTERTFSIIKPDATRRNITGKVNAVIEGAGLRIVAQKRVKLTDDQAEEVLRSAQGAPLLWRTGGPDDRRAGGGAGAGRRQRRGQAYREVMGATNPEGCRRRHHPQALRPVDRRELGPRLRQLGQRQDRNRAVLRRTPISWAEFPSPLVGEGVGAADG